MWSVAAYWSRARALQGRAKHLLRIINKIVAAVGRRLMNRTRCATRGCSMLARQRRGAADSVLTDRWL